MQALQTPTQPPVSPLVLADRLITLAQEADRAGYLALGDAAAGPGLRRVRREAASELISARPALPRPASVRVMMLEKRSVTLAGHRTSVALEPEFWAALETLAASRRQTLAGLVAAVDAARDAGRPLASALRVFALSARG